MRLALFGRELERIARARWLSSSMCGLLILLLACIGFIWTIDFSPFQRGSFEARAYQGAIIFSAIWGTLLVAMLLIIPIVVAGAIVGERQRGTGEVLATTPMSGLELLIGLAGPRLLALILMAATAVPVLASCIAIGGVTIEQLIYGLTTLGIVIVWLSSICIMLSATARTFQIALARGYAMVIFFGVILPIAEAWILIFQGPTAVSGAWWSLNKWINPLVSSFDPNATLFGIPQGQAMLSGGLQSLIYLSIAALQIRGSLATSSRQVDRPRRAKSGEVRVGSLHSTRAQRALRPVRARENPLVWREIVAPERMRGIIVGIARFVVIAFFCSLFLPLFKRRWDWVDAFMRAVFAITSFLFVLIGASICVRLGGALPRERQTGRIESLMVTAMDRGRIFSGLTLAAWMGNRTRLWTIVLLAVIGAIIVVAFGGSGSNVPALAGLAPMTSTVVLVFLCTGIAAQVTTRVRTIAAGVTAALAATLLLIAGYMLLTILAAETHIIDYRTSEWIMMLHPFGAFALVDSSWLSSTAAITLLGSLAWSALGIWLWTRARRRFITLPAERWLGGESGQERDDPDQEKPGDRPYVP